MEHNPVLWMLVGVPGSGKSSWITKADVLEEGRGRDTTILSTDYFIDCVAKDRNLTYNDVFRDTIEDATRKMYEDLDWALARSHNIVWDQTNISLKSRKEKLAKIPDHYKKIAVFFSTPEPKELDRRLGSRPGKTIPPHVIDGMVKMLEQPTLQEGFDEIRLGV